MELTVDPVDELVANDLLGRNRTLWFPAPPDDGRVWPPSMIPRSCSISVHTTASTR